MQKNSAKKTHTKPSNAWTKPIVGSFWLRHMRALKTAFQSLKQHAFLVFVEVCIFSVMLWLPWLFSAFIAPLSTWANEESSRGIYVFFELGTESSTIGEVEAALYRALPIERVVYHDETAAWHELLHTLNMDESSMVVREGVLASYLSVQLQTPVRQHHLDVVDALQGRNPSIQTVLYNIEHADRIEFLLRTLRTIQLFAIVVGALIVSAIVVLTVRFLVLRQRRSIMLLHDLGAPLSYIATSLQYHVIITALFGSALSYLGYGLSLRWLQRFDWQTLGFFFDPNANEMPFLLGIAGVYVLFSVLCVRFCVARAIAKRDASPY